MEDAEREGRVGSKGRADRVGRGGGSFTPSHFITMPQYHPSSTGYLVSFNTFIANDSSVGVTTATSTAAEVEKEVVKEVVLITSNGSVSWMNIFE